MSINFIIQQIIDSNEIFYPIHPDLLLSNYEINKNSQIRNRFTKHYLSQSSNEAGYKSVYLIIDNGKQVSMKVHFIAARTFVEGYSPEKTVDHIDRTPSNNKVENLRWATRDGRKHNKTTSRPVEQLTLDNEFMARFESVSEAARNNINIAQQNISACCRDKRETAGGYKWRYIEDPDLPGEKWLPLVISGKKIKVSSIGRAQMKDTRLKTYGSKCANGYRRVSIYINSEQKYYLVHRLVMMAFSEEYNENLVVNHINGDKEDNRAENLECITHSFTMRHVARNKVKWLR